jgi:hypothetical protein
LRVEYSGVREESPVIDDGEFELRILTQLKILKAAIRKCRDFGCRAEGQTKMITAARRGANRVFNLWSFSGAVSSAMHCGDDCHFIDITFV